MSNNQDVEVVPDRALFFELEYLATSGRTFLFEALLSVLQKHGVKLTHAEFSRHFAGDKLERGLRRLEQAGGVKKLDADKTISAVLTAYRSSIMSNGHRNKELVNLTSDLKKHGIMLGALTCLDPECVDALLGQLNLSSDDVVVLHASERANAFPSAQDWMTLAREMGVGHAFCTVAATSAAACRSALCAGMRCFALPDEYTSFQDFSGADYVLETLDASSEKLIMKLVEAF